MKHSKKSMGQPKSSPTQQHTIQPEPFTPGITKAQIRQHAYELYRDKLAHASITLEDWVLAEKDLAASMEADNLPK
jgi:hypothetical protein